MSLLKGVIRNFAKPLHRFFRKGKSEKFSHLLTAHPGRLLDVGGGTGISGEFVSLYQKFDNVTIVNLDPPDRAASSECDLRIVNADGRNLPFADNSFDWVFSNAVIEHVGGWQDQQQFAAEIRRVASSGYFVSTPYLYFPIEPHALLPLYQFYPEHFKPFALRFSPGYMKNVEKISLLTKKKMQELFPDASVQLVNGASSVIAFRAAN